MVGGFFNGRAGMLTNYLFYIFGTFSNTKRERTPCFPTFFVVFWKAALFVFYSQNPEIALSLSKAAMFYRDNVKSF